MWRTNGRRPRSRPGRWPSVRRTSSARPCMVISPATGVQRRWWRRSAVADGSNGELVLTGRRRGRFLGILALDRSAGPVGGWVPLGTVPGRGRDPVDHGRTGSRSRSGCWCPGHPPSPTTGRSPAGATRRGRTRWCPTGSGDAVLDEFDPGVELESQYQREARSGGRTGVAGAGARREGRGAQPGGGDEGATQVTATMAAG